MPHEVADVIGVSIDGAGREIADQHIFGHSLGERRETIAIGSHEKSSLLSEKDADTPIVHRLRLRMLAHPRRASPFNQNARYNRTSSE